MARNAQIKLSDVATSRVNNLNFLLQVKAQIFFAYKQMRKQAK